MKKYKNVKAITARECGAYVKCDNGQIRCYGTPEPFINPTCNGYKCKCTEYKYDKKRGKLI